jgi:predicted SprT family Zn-dependent metalloprotease
MGATFEIDETKCDPALAATIKKLILCINHHKATQADLDRYIFAYICSCTKHPFLETCTWQQLVIDTRDVFDIRRCVDIGYCIRDIILKNKEQDVVTKVIQSSLPYLKHNRLNFPAFNTCSYEGMQDITRIVFGCCLGLFDEDGKKPPWSTRVYLVVFMHELLSRGSKRDLYVFCTTHMALVRIAAIECFIAFLDKNMPTELEHMPCLFSVDSTVSSMHFSDLRQVCNNFRTISFDGAELNLSELNTKAVVMLERCNRICSHKIRSLPRHVHASIPLSLVPQAINAPLSSDIIRQIIHPELDTAQLVTLKEIQNIITRYPLVLELQKLQIESLKNLSSENTVTAAKSLYCYVCFGCIDTFTQLDSKMRVHSGSVVYCQNCNSHEHIIRINCFGSIVCIKESKYFWCPFCRVVHKWSASGYEMQRCDLQDTTEVRAKSVCVVCRKNTNIETFTLLDRKLGILQTVNVCFKHRPWPHQMPYIHDISSFKDAVVAKNSNKIIY